MKIHLLLSDGSAGGTVFNVRAIEEENGHLICRMLFTDTPKHLPQGVYVNVEADEDDTDESDD